MNTESGSILMIIIGYLASILFAFLYGKRQENLKHDLKNLKLKDQIQQNYEKNQKKMDGDLAARRLIVGGYLRKKVSNSKVQATK